ncbi:MAG: alanine dehydrogenase [Candidatus Marinimicrobia bacterium]|nr:alanine dehydrogenase [Candidatus Neomarinimicrobiota bacterium]
MIVGVPKEIKADENRVALLPFAVQRLTNLGCKVIIENNAGIGSGYTNTDYINSGATVVEKSSEVFAQSDMIIKVKELQPTEFEIVREEQIIFTYFHFAADKKLTDNFIESNAIAISYETVQKDDGSLPLLVPMSEVAGRMAIQNGAKALEANMGGKGLLLSGVPGVEPATVTILGGGIVGMNAAKLAAGLGSKVYILDVSANRLKYLDDIMPSNVFTLYSHEHNIKEVLSRTDLLIGSVLIPGAKAPKLVNREMLSILKPGSVIVDVAVDQGGCIETSKPTTHKNPTFVVDDIIHYCVANMPGAVPFTSTTALCNVTYPYIEYIVENGLKKALLNNSSLAKGLNIYKGKITHQGVSDAFNYNFTNFKDIIQ